MDIMTSRAALYESLAEISDQGLLDQLYSLHIFLGDKEGHRVKYYLYRFLHNIPVRNSYNPQDLQRLRDAITQAAASPNVYKIIQPVIARLFSQQRRGFARIEEALARQSVEASWCPQPPQPPQVSSPVGVPAYLGAMTRLKLKTLCHLHLHCRMAVTRLLMLHAGAVDARLGALLDELGGIRAELRTRAGRCAACRMIVVRRWLASMQLHCSTLASRLRVLRLIRDSQLD